MHLEIDTSDPVLVTGATGFLSGWIVKQLVDAGATVHATVRDPADYSKCGHLKNLSNTSKGKIELFKADLPESDGPIMKPGLMTTKRHLSCASAISQAAFSALTFEKA